MSRIKRLLGLTATITTGTLIACIIWYGVTITLKGIAFSEAVIPYATLMQILLLGFVCGAATEVILPDKDMSAKEVVIRLAVHSVFITSAVLVLGLVYGWYEFSVGGVLLMCLTSAAIYAATAFINFWNSKKVADEMTEHLEKYRK